MNNGFIKGIIVGAVAGAAAGIIFDPMSGCKKRQLKRKMKKIIEDMTN